MLDLSSLKKACEALDLALKVYDKSTLLEDSPEKILLRDGVIQRFEFTYELSWKMLKRYLDEYSLEKADSLNNRELFRIGWEQRLIADPEKWFHYLKMRNQTSHVYDKDKDEEVFAATRDFFQDAQYLLQRLSEKVK